MTTVDPVDDDYTEYITRVSVRTQRQKVPAGYDPRDLDDRVEAEIISEQVFQASKQFNASSLLEALPVVNTSSLENNIRDGLDPDPNRAEIAKQLLDADGDLCVRFDHGPGGYSMYLRPAYDGTDYWDKRIVGPSHDGTEEYGTSGINLKLKNYEDDHISLVPSDEAPVEWGEP